MDLWSKLKVTRTKWLRSTLQSTYIPNGLSALRVVALRVEDSAVCSEGNFPDYNQHICCGGCYSGCGPVAWTQVFGYYDRRAASPNSIFSSTIYGDSRTKAPLSLTNDVRSFVESIRSWVRTYCDDDQGATKTSKMHLIAPWFRARQGSKARVVSYLQSRKRRSTGGAIAGRGSRSWIESKGVRWLDSGYPVIFGFLTERKAGQFAVATKYQKTSRSYRHCEKKTTGWWFEKKPKQSAPGRQPTITSSSYTMAGGATTITGSRLVHSALMLLTLQNDASRIP